MAPHNNIVLFDYPFSPYAKRVAWYLTLRGIEYAQCVQPVTLPREDLNALGVKYRRIPLLSIGRNIYCDTRLILEKLEQRFPSGSLGACQPEQRALEKLLQIWTIDGGVFSRAAQALPPEMPLLNDPKWVKDREDYMGRSWAKEDVAKGRPEALAHLRGAFDLLESTLLADGRDWVLGTEKPSLADIEAIWPFHWLSGLEGALPPSLFGKEEFPKVYGWIDRFSSALKAAKASAPNVISLKGAEAIQFVTQAELAEPEGDVDAKDPLGLKKGQDVESWPTDSGFNHRDRGQLVTLTQHEVVLKTQAKVGHKDIRIHHPRTNFRIRPPVWYKPHWPSIQD
ncbi:MAG: hypothetical protein L6R40_005298 [Gallowayella cf. fulva]|nr:MAG: hypothetical protein L6R40_005298 [Xanthomendoza cf. fulva]